MGKVLSKKEAMGCGSEYDLYDSHEILRQQLELALKGIKYLKVTRENFRNRKEVAEDILKQIKKLDE